MTHKKLQIVPQPSRPANPQKTEKPALDQLIEQTKEIVGKNPDKAARILSGWIKESSRKKAA